MVCSCVVITLFGFEARVFDDLGVADDLGPQESAEFLRRVGDDVYAHADETITGLGLVHHARDVALDARRQFRRHAGRAEHGAPRGDGKTLDAGLRHGRDFGRERRTRGRGVGEATQLAAFDAVSYTHLRAHE